MEAVKLVFTKDSEVVVVPEFVEAYTTCNTLDELFCVADVPPAVPA
jgi:hypothetical protein